jgi:hypothetical protein
VTFDPTINLGTILTGVPMILAVIWGAAVIHTKVGIIEHKLDTFITKAEVATLKLAADREHEMILEAQKIVDTGLQVQINGIRSRLDLRST